MAERRMFAKTIIDSDAFVDMPMSSRCLYYDLSMRADDDGFVNNPKKIQRSMGASDDDMKLLIAKKFILPFESGVIVIKHWRIHNYIRNDRYKETVYQEELAKLELKPNGSYTFKGQNDVFGIPNGYQMDTQVSIGKDSIGKSKKDIGVFDQYCGDDELLRSALNDFEVMRKSMTKPLTERGKELLCKELDKLKNQGENLIDILNNSIMNNWQGVFAPKPESRKRINEPIPDYSVKNYNNLEKPVVMSDAELEEIKARLRKMGEKNK